MKGGAAVMGPGREQEQRGTLWAQVLGALACSEHMREGEVRLWMLACLECVRVGGVRV